MALLLLIDDEPALVRALGIGLRARGYQLATARDGASGLAEAVRQRPDVVILDLGLPDLDGVEVCRRIRGFSPVPILVLSAHGEEERKICALDAGADDFVTKPFSMAELEARLRVALRHGHAGGLSRGDPVIRIGDLQLDLSGHTAAIAGAQLQLTATEYAMLAYLARHQGRIVTHQVLLQHVWGGRYGADAHYLRVYANRLRRKFGPAHGRLLRTHHGVGYELSAEGSLPTAGEPATPV
ncbi:MAG TPA: response regulator transcription factor [Verrucomicrobiae bacterium]|nr:response regulator transcription factor [Verrucomicrobiae bacterium]